MVTDQAGLEETVCEGYRTIRQDFEQLLSHTYRRE